MFKKVAQDSIPQRDLTLHVRPVAPPMPFSCGNSMPYWKIRSRNDGITGRMLLARLISAIPYGENAEPVRLIREVESAGTLVRPVRVSVAPTAIFDVIESCCRPATHAPVTSASASLNTEVARTHRTPPRAVAHPCSPEPHGQSQRPADLARQHHRYVAGDAIDGGCNGNPRSVRKQPPVCFHADGPSLEIRGGSS